MYPPSHVCESLHALHLQLRLAWVGRPKKHELELNPGDFALIQLYHISDVGDLNDPSTFRTLWNVQPVLDEHGETQFERIDRGPIFNKHGGTSRDWDPLFRVPVFVATLNEEFGVSIEDILTGRIIERIKLWMRPIVQRVKESAVEQGKDLKRRASDIGHEVAKDVWKEAQKSDAATVIMANKHTKGAMAEIEQRKQHEDLASYYMPPEV